MMKPPEKGEPVMANTNTPFGFKQYQGTGSAPTYEQVEVQIVYNASAIYFGDPVTPNSSGYVVRASSSGGSSDTQIAGIFVGCQYLSVSQKRTVWSNYWPGSDVASTSTVTGYIVNDPNAKFLVQTDATGAAQTNINNTVGFTIGSGNANNGLSGAFLNISTAGTDNTQPFKIVSLVTNPPGSNGTEAGAYNYVVVAFNNVSTKQLTGI
jgi:hypothetical protein